MGLFIPDRAAARRVFGLTATTSPGIFYPYHPVADFALHRVARGGRFLARAEPRPLPGSPRLPGRRPRGKAVGWNWATRRLFTGVPNPSATKCSKPASSPSLTNSSRKPSFAQFPFLPSYWLSTSQFCNGPKARSARQFFRPRAPRATSCSSAFSPSHRLGNLHC